MQEIKIGKQIWMAENLNVETFRNGDPIPHVVTPASWKKTGKSDEPMYCFYDSDSANEKKYGKLYNWCAVIDPRGLAPEGWHIPSYDEWNVLIDFLGGEKIAGIKMKSTIEWLEYEDQNRRGTNECGFSALPGGFRDLAGKFVNSGKSGYWWSSSEKDLSSAFSVGLWYNQSSVDKWQENKGLRGLSVRCIKDI